MLARSLSQVTSSRLLGLLLSKEGLSARGYGGIKRLQHVQANLAANTGCEF